MALCHPHPSYTTPSQSNELLKSLLPAIRSSVSLSSPPPPASLVALVASLSLHSPLPTLECYELLVADDPMALITMDEMGRTPLDIARGRDEGEDVISFLEEKTATAEGILEAYGEMDNEEFRRRFIQWEEL